MLATSRDAVHYVVRSGIQPPPGLERPLHRHCVRLLVAGQHSLGTLPPTERTQVFQGNKLQLGRELPSETVPSPTRFFGQLGQCLTSLPPVSEEMPRDRATRVRWRRKDPLADRTLR